MGIERGNVFFEEIEYATAAESWQKLFPNFEKRIEAYEKLLSYLNAESGVVDGLKKICAVGRFRSLDDVEPKPLRFLENFSNLFEFIAGYPDEGYLDFYTPYNYVGNTIMETLRHGGNVYLEMNLPGCRDVCRLFAHDFFKDGEPDREKIDNLTKLLHKKAQQMTELRQEEERELAATHEK